MTFATSPNTEEVVEYNPPLHTITQAARETARKKSDEMGIVKGSIHNGTRNYQGFLGEEIASWELEAEVSNTYDYDLILPDGKTVDVKTVLSDYPPQPHYDCRVEQTDYKAKAGYNCDYFAFVRIVKDHKKGWYLGKISKEDFFNKAEFKRRGDSFQAGRNSLQFRGDCYIIPAKELEL